MSTKPTLYQAVLPDGAIATRHTYRYYAFAVAQHGAAGWKVVNWCSRDDLALDKQRAILNFNPAAITAIVDVDAVAA